jgi:predicted dehydrogenase
LKRYVICGVSNRAISMFMAPIIKMYNEENQIVGLLDIDSKRFEVARSRLPELNGLPCYTPDQFDQMIKQTKPDVVIVAGADHTHVDYMVKSLEMNLDVITEKPMVTNSESVRTVLKAEAASKGKVTVSFNYRYSPIHRKIKEMILEGKVGRITSIDLNWYIDTYHGASYFKRWNRQRSNSGGLPIHKSSHHFDLVNWWVDQNPVEAFAYGALNYYGPNGELNPSRKDGRYCGTCEEKLDCAYYMRWSSRNRELTVMDDHLNSFEAGKKSPSMYSDYRPDMCIFDSEIDIEDTYVCTVKYDKGALLSYSANFSVPYEGYRLAINGTKGRIETQEFHAPSRIPFDVPKQTIEYFPMFGSKEIVNVVFNEGGHGGGDPLIQEDLFLGPDPRRTYEILSGTKAGANSVLLGEAVWRSITENKPIQIEELLK